MSYVDVIIFYVTEVIVFNHFRSESRLSIRPMGRAELWENFQVRGGRAVPSTEPYTRDETVTEIIRRKASGRSFLIIGTLPIMG